MSIFSIKSSDQESEKFISQFHPLEVRVREGQFDSALRLFRFLVQREEILLNSKKKSRYEKPSVARRRKSSEARTRKFLSERRIKNSE